MKYLALALLLLVSGCDVKIRLEHSAWAMIGTVGTIIRVRWPRIRRRRWLRPICLSLI